MVEITCDTKVVDLIPEGDDCYGKADDETCYFLFNGYWCNLRKGYCKAFISENQKRDDCPKPPGEVKK